MLREIEQGIREAQHLQDTEGHEHPNEVQVFTFPCPALIKWILKAKRIPGLTFEKFQDETYGVFRAAK